MSSKRDAGLTWRERKKTVQRSGDDGWEAPPVPIPNTAVKLPRVESTGLEAAWEDRLLPVTRKPPQKPAGAFYYVENYSYYYHGFMNAHVMMLHYGNDLLKL